MEKRIEEIIEKLRTLRVDDFDLLREVVEELECLKNEFENE